MRFFYFVFLFCVLLLLIVCLFFNIPAIVGTERLVLAVYVQQTANRRISAMKLFRAEKQSRSQIRKRKRLIMQSNVE
jgi:hypothetical protein